MAPYVFLFDADELDAISTGGYHAPALTSFFDALLEGDADADARFVVLHGDLLHRNLAYRVTAVRKSRTKLGVQVGSVQSGDRDLLMTVIWDLCDSIGEQWHTVELALLPDLLGRRNVYALAPSELSGQAAEQIDSALRRVAGYAGAFVPDVGNPIHQRVTEGSLIAEPFYFDRSLLYDPWASEDPFDPPPLIRHGDEWYASLPFRAVRYIREDEDRTSFPSWPDGDLSPRGELSLAIQRKRAARTHLDRVASSLDTVRPRDEDSDFEIDTTTMPRAADAVVDEDKLTQYVLNPDHPIGGPKARLFDAALGIQAADWRYLAAQLKEGLNEAHSVLKVRSTQYGVQYHVVTPITGRNDQIKPVLSAWEVKPDAPPRLVTAYLADANTDTASLPAPRADLVVTGMEGDDRWAKVWELATIAGKTAASETVPTPIRVDGIWYEDGSFGFAHVTVKDARRGFARWVVKTGRAHTMRGQGAVIGIPGHLYDQSSNYAAAFAGVLKHNGIDCTWASDYD